ncbi:hypothetical protein ACFQYP_25325 [Nonomuraea antimicrobica]
MRCRAGDLRGRGPGSGGETLALVVDDAQWADRPSLRALGYALRRVRSGRVLVLVVCRDAADPWLPEGLRRLLRGDGTLRVALAGLSASELAALVAGLAPSAHGPGTDGATAVVTPFMAPFVTPFVAPFMVTARAEVVVTATSGMEAAARTTLGAEAAARLREHTLGNPLHARALLDVLPLAVLDDSGARLPAPATYQRPFARRLHACAPATRRLVEACAVLGGRCPLHVAAAVATGIDEPLNALEEAVAAGLLRELPGRLIGFPEPLAVAAAYDGIGVGARARLHLAASRLAEDTGAGLRHRAVAAGGPDEVLAEELASFAAKAAQHGQWQEAAAHLELAAGLTESAGRRDELRTAAMEHVLVGGDVIRAAALAAVHNADPRPVRRYVLGRLALAAGRFDEAYELLAEAWRHAEPGFAADVAEQLAWLHLVTGDPVAAADWARLAIEQPIQGAVARPYDVLALSGALGSPRAGGAVAMGGAPGAASPRPDGVVAAGGAPGAASPRQGGVVTVGGASGAAGSQDGDSLADALAHLARDEPGLAYAVLKRVVAAAGTAGLPHHRLPAEALLAVAEHGLARWDESAARAERALAEAVALGQRWLLPCLAVACVAPLAARGDRERALAHATAAGEAARRMGHAMGERQADLAMELLGAGHWAEGGRSVPGGLVVPVFVPDPRPARIEALVADGRLEEAAAFLAAYEGGASAEGDDGDGDGDGDRAVARQDVAERTGEQGTTEWRRAERLRLGGLLLAARNVPNQAEERFGRALALVGAGCARWRRRGCCWTWAGCYAVRDGVRRRPNGSGRRGPSSSGWGRGRWSSGVFTSWRRAGWSRSRPYGSGSPRRSSAPPCLWPEA